jgi:hypothetical protein
MNDRDPDEVTPECELPVLLCYITVCLRTYLEVGSIAKLSISVHQVHDRVIDIMLVFRHGRLMTQYAKSYSSPGL